MDTLGKRIKEYRLSKNLSQEQLAKAIGTTKSLISMWERDEVKNPTFHHLFALADALDVDARRLAVGHNDPLAAPIRGFPVSDTGRFRLRHRR